jgi:hypothetical protein
MSGSALASTVRLKPRLQKFQPKSGQKKPGHGRV